MTMWSPDNPWQYEQTRPVIVATVPEATAVAPPEVESNITATQWSRWTDAQEHWLRENYPKMRTWWCAEQLGRSIRAVRNRVIQLGITIPEIEEEDSDEVASVAQQEEPLICNQQVVSSNPTAGPEEDQDDQDDPWGF
jgi:hypothetical protein